MALQELALDLEPVAEEDHDQGDRREVLDEPRVRAEASTSSASLAEQEADQHEDRRERQETAVGEAREQRAADQEGAENGGAGLGARSLL